MTISEREPRTVGAALAAATAALAASPSARLDARLLLAGALGRDAAWLLAHDGDDLDGGAGRIFDGYVAARATGMPLAYVLGHAVFYGRRFAVDRDVLVPRPETEELVELALAALRGRPEPRVLDVGTGSGAIAVTLAAELPRARVVAIDVSEAALAVARRNAQALGVSERVRFERDATFGVSAAGGARFDAIVANLPYVRSADLAPAPDPTSFEPRLALDGGDDGLDAYRGLVAVAPRLLATGGALLCEAGPDTARPLAALARSAFGAAATIAIERDLAGRERVVALQLPRPGAPRETAASPPNIDGP